MSIKCNNVAFEILLHKFAPSINANYMKKTVSLFALSLGVLLHSCDDHDHDHGDAVPTITVISPTQDYVHQESDTLWIRVNFKSEAELENYEIRLLDSATSQSYFYYSGHSHNKELTTNLWTLPTVDTLSTFKLNIITKDHDGEQNNAKQITFKINNVN